jgi:hypothetical protein
VDATSGEFLLSVNKGALVGLGAILERLEMEDSGVCDEYDDAAGDPADAGECMGE